MRHAHSAVLACLPEEPEARASLLAEARRLLGLLPDWPRQPWFLELLGVDDTAPALSARTRSAVRRRYTALPLAALLLEVPDPSQARADYLDPLRAWALAAALSAIVEEWTNHSTWRAAARGMRILSTSHAAAEARSRTPEISNGDPARVRRTLLDWHAREVEIGSDLPNTLQDMVRALAQMTGKARHRVTDRARANRSESERHAARVRGVSMPMGHGGPLVDATFDLFDFNDEELCSTEEAADVARLAPVYFGLVEQDLAPGAHDMAMELDSLDTLVEADGAVITASAHLTGGEARDLARALREALRQQGGAADMTLLAASLLTGRAIEELIALPRAAPEEAGQAWWHIGPDQIALAFAPAVSGAPKPPLNGFKIIMPDWLGTPLRRVLDAPPDPGMLRGREARAWLRGTRFPDSRAPRVRRIASALVAALRAQGVDSVLVGLLAGADIRHTPQIYYARVEVAKLDVAYRMYRKDWLGLEDAGPAVVPTGSAKVTGSRRAASQAVIKGIFAARGHALEEATARLPGAVEEYHGAFVSLIALVLLWSTGRRPHGIVCPPLNDICLDGAWPVMRVRDKGSRAVDDARWLPLPRVAVTALNTLRIYLSQSLLPWAAIVWPREVGDAVRQALDGTLSPIWHIGGGVVAPLECRHFWDNARPPRQPRNLFRHYWRSRFIEKNIPGWQADYWMGHGGWGSAQYLAASGYTAGDLEDIARLIDREAEEIGIVIPEPRRLLR